MVDDRLIAAAIMTLKRNSDEVGHDCRITASTVFKEMNLSSRKHIASIKNVLDEYVTEKYLKKVGRYYEINTAGLKFFKDTASGTHGWVTTAYENIKKYGDVWPDINFEAELQYHPTWFKRARLPALTEDTFFLDGINRHKKIKKKNPPATGYE